MDDKYPPRQYQLDISQTAMLHNTLVSLPTGLGKTLIAAVVMYNFYHWFPTGKVLFLAPTLPLVQQQVVACYQIMGIPAHATAVLTGKVPSRDRQVLWRERRVFFCTPQTVQKDLEHYTGRLDPTRVVCVALDEAHRAQGDYAYGKIVAYLHAAGAKFRVLGLSATPGTNIAAIQKVVDALHMNKIEARTEADPDVAQYIHARKSEIVVVPQASVVQPIEQALHALIGPLLQRLQSAGALRTNCGLATITAYSIIQSRQKFSERQGVGEMAGIMMGYFCAAQVFVQMRADLHKHGVGLVRTKLVRIRNERQRGIMASLVKGKEFQALWNQVESATFDPDSSQADMKDRLKNNPKLEKLQEILVEHFERARATQKSSRAIVFSQFRDSVSEIASVLDPLKPLIRPRHFVGQGKGSKGEGQIKGMKQAEQHEVIREFRAGQHNVLVCTCIGEEGLDIGEVDLIVNFDTLRSPIRTIQRIGRTGRKRDGRVVCLVAEGAEERTLSASRQSERNLAHALRNPRSFKVKATNPMLPSVPTLLEQKMKVSENFRVSQVGGHGGRTGSTAPHSGWKLSSQQERKRGAVLGVIGVSRSCKYEVSGISPSLLRRFLSGRKASLHSKQEKKRSMGRTTDLLRHIEVCHNKTSSGKQRNLRSRVGRREESNLQAFPLLPLDQNETFANLQHEPDVNGSPNRPGTIRPGCDHKVVSDPVRLINPTAKPAIDAQSESVNRTGAAESSTLPHVPVSTNPYSKKEKAVLRSTNDSRSVANPTATTLSELRFCPPSRSGASVDPRVELGAGISGKEKVGSDQVQRMTTEQPARTTPNPYCKESLRSVGTRPELRTKSSQGERAIGSETVALGSLPVVSRAPELSLHAVTSVGARADEMTTLHPSLSPVNPRCQEVAPNTDCISPAVDGVGQPESLTVDDFCLPSQDDSSDDESEERGAKNEKLSSQPAHVLNMNLNVLTTTREIGSSQFPEQAPEGNQGQQYFLPSQNDSSSEDESDNESSNPADVKSKSPVEIPGASTLTESNSTEQYTNRDPNYVLPTKRVCPASQDSSQSIQPLRKRKFNLQTQASGASSTLAAGEETSPASVQSLPNKKRQGLVERVRSFFDEEADVCSHGNDRDSEDETAQVEAMEEQELLESSFINDSSQLGFSPDSLDRVLPDDGANHQALDNERARAAQFSTPLLNRRMRGAGNRDSWLESAPDSASGLGNMHFLRSVIEHHKQGGGAEEIEQAYNHLVEEGESRV